MDITTTKGYGATGLTALVHGPPGSGKTYAARTCPGRTLVVSAEAGLLSLRDCELDVAEVGSLADLKHVYFLLNDQDQPYEWVYIDSLSEVAEICLAEEMGKTAHGVKAYGEMMTAIMRLVKAFRDLDVNVVMTAKQGRDVDPDGVAYMAPELPGRKLSTKLPYEFDLIVGAGTHTDSDGNVHRVFRTTSGQGVLAKDRSGALAPLERPDWGRIHRKISNQPTPTSGE